MCRDIHKTNESSLSTSDKEPTMNMPTHQSERERRESTRLPLLHLTRYQVSQKSKGANLINGEAFIVNINEDGVCFFLDRKIQPNTVIQFDLYKKHIENKTRKSVKIKWIQSVPWGKGCFAGSAFVA